jgi:hypothetical protein
LILKIYKWKQKDEFLLEYNNLKTQKLECIVIGKLKVCDMNTITYDNLLENELLNLSYKAEKLL